LGVTLFFSKLLLNRLLHRRCPPARSSLPLRLLLLCFLFGSHIRAVYHRLVIRSASGPCSLADLEATLATGVRKKSNSFFRDIRCQWEAQSSSFTIGECSRGCCQEVSCAQFCANSQVQTGSLKFGRAKTEHSQAIEIPHDCFHFSGLPRNPRCDLNRL
jgi:hypothetical protein